MSAGSWRIVFVIGLVLLAGCASGIGPAPGGELDTLATATSTSGIETTPQTVTPTPSPTATPSPTPSPTATPSPTPTPPQNPWRKEPIIIGIDSSSDPDRNYTNHVIDAVEYWQDDGANHTDWRASFTVVPNASNPDIIIRFVNEIQRCGISDSDVILGCASLLHADSMPDHPEVVKVNLGLTDQSTYRVVRHELGHVLGLQHGEGPDGVMSTYTQVFDQVVRVHVTLESEADHEERDTKNQLGYVFDYYSSGAEGFLNEQVEFALVEDPRAADVIVQVHEDGDESRARYEGDQFIIEINGIETDHRGWHAGAWLGFYFGANATEELPPPFDEPESDPRSNWWH